MKELTVTKEKIPNICWNKRGAEVKHVEVQRSTVHLGPVQLYNGESILVLMTKGQLLALY